MQAEALALKRTWRHEEQSKCRHLWLLVLAEHQQPLDMQMHTQALNAGLSCRDPLLLVSTLGADSRCTRCIVQQPRSQTARQLQHVALT